MRNGRGVEPRPTLAEIRARAAAELERLPEPLRRIEPGEPYPVEMAKALVRLAATVDRSLAHAETKP
jgi:nicotinate phosphoribosyltransferase